MLYNVKQEGDKLGAEPTVTGEHEADRIGSHQIYQLSTLREGRFAMW